MVACVIYVIVPSCYYFNLLRVHLLSWNVELLQGWNCFIIFFFPGLYWAAGTRGAMACCITCLPPAFPQQVRLLLASQEKPSPDALLFLKVRGRSSFGLAASAPDRPRGCCQTLLGLLASLSRADLGLCGFNLKRLLVFRGCYGPWLPPAPVIAKFFLLWNVKMNCRHVLYDVEEVWMSNT